MMTEVPLQTSLAVVVIYLGCDCICYEVVCLFILLDLALAFQAFHLEREVAQFVLSECYTLIAVISFHSYISIIYLQTK
jgi:hypothetical protein